MVLQQYVEKWFPEDPEDLARMGNRTLKKLLLDVSVFWGWLLVGWLALLAGVWALVGVLRGWGGPKGG